MSIYYCMSAHLLVGSRIVYDPIRGRKRILGLLEGRGRWLPWIHYTSNRKHWLISGLMGSGGMALHGVATHGVRSRIRWKAIEFGRLYSIYSLGWMAMRDMGSGNFSLFIKWCGILGSNTSTSVEKQRACYRSLNSQTISSSYSILCIISCLISWLDFHNL